MFIAGVDEVGRGPLAGPVVAGAVLFPPGFTNSEIKDSKQLSPQKRELLSSLIKEKSLAWSIVAVGHHRITSLNIRQASKLAMSLAVAKLSQKHSINKVLVDGNMPIMTPLSQETIIGGDALCLCISAASIIAKVWRDGLMKILDGKYPGYGFTKHAGYPTPSHKESLRLLGPSKVHRRTFQGVKEFYAVVSSKDLPTSVLPVSNFESEKDYYGQTWRNSRC